MSDADWGFYEAAANEAAAMVAAQQAMGKTTGADAVEWHRRLASLSRRDSPLRVPFEARKEMRGGAVADLPPEQQGMSYRQRYESKFAGLMTGAQLGQIAYAPEDLWSASLAQGVTNPLGFALHGTGKAVSAMTGDVSPTPFYQQSSGIKAPPGTEAVVRLAAAWEEDPQRKAQLLQQADQLKAESESKVTEAGATGDSSGSLPPHQPERQMSKGAATFEDFIKAALRGAGYGSPEAQAYHYDPWGQTGGTAPYQVALTGSYDALNPHIAGGQAPTIKDVQRLHTGTHQSQQAYADALRAQGQDMAQRAADAGEAGNVAMQQGEGLRAGMMQKQALADQRNQAMSEKALYQGQLRAAADIERSELATPAEKAEARKMARAAAIQFADYLKSAPGVDVNAGLQEEPIYE